MIKNIEKVLIVILLILLLWFGSAIVRLENYHYAVQVGVCEENIDPDGLATKRNCLNESETRTNVFWHLLYGLEIL